MPIDMELRGTHPGRWNIDHIVPRSKGDPNHWILGNLRLAHRACNMQRNDATLPEPDDILYRELLAAAIDKFEDPEHHVESEIERLRWRAATRTAMVGMKTRMVASNLENSTDEDFKAEVRDHLNGYQRRADEALAELVAVQAELIAKRSRLE